jgi:regulator of RNase E activity RraA
MNVSAPLSNMARENLARSGASNITNSLLKRGPRNTFLLGLQPMEPAQTPFVGPAFTMRFIPAREDLDSTALYQQNDSLHPRAIEECPRTQCSITLHPVEFDAPIGCANVAVYPSDIVVGDAEGSSPSRAISSTRWQTRLSPPPSKGTRRCAFAAWTLHFRAISGDTGKHDRI